VPENKTPFCFNNWFEELFSGGKNSESVNEVEELLLKRKALRWLSVVLNLVMPVIKLYVKN